MNFNQNRHIYFTGFMASGKTRVGRALAKRLERDFIDTDQLISERTGKTITEIFQEEGEAVFRKMEYDLIHEIAEDPVPKIISLGGGSLTQSAVVTAIHKSGLLIRLWAEENVLSERIARKNTRPLMIGLSPEERLEKIRTMLAEREVYYKLADFSVETSDASSEEHITEHIMQLLRFWDTHALNVETKSGERYPIFIGHQLADTAGVLLEGLRISPSHSFLVCTDSNVAKAQANKLTQLRYQAGGCPVFKFRAGEVNKSLSSLNQLYTFMLRRRFTRKTCLLQFGGGVVGDMAGFGAATYQRGIPFIQIPTSLLSMVDSSVGGKVAVNHPEGKNMIGAFYQPRAVICDLDALATLPESEYLSGLAEIVKYGVIYDAEFFALMEENISAIRAKDSGFLTQLIRRSCEIKAEVVGIDEKETGLRAILNYGHTFGHAIEKITNYNRFSHGIAVGLGMRVAGRLAVLCELWSKEDERRVQKLLDAIGLPAIFDVDTEEAWNAMGVDKKAEKNSRVYILPTRIGAVRKIPNIEKELVDKAWDAIRNPSNPGER
ncbi:MAG: 3-dehydroquinate synthase [Fibrobacter sp.]|jgi:3-dehydroquinate synthase|nr:3-dehydroquinate synthase [Fibrobacter sp.]